MEEQKVSGKKDKGMCRKGGNNNFFAIDGDDGENAEEST